MLTCTNHLCTQTNFHLSFLGKKDFISVYHMSYISEIFCFSVKVTNNFDKFEPIRSMSYYIANCIV